ncbi:predicted protein [Streptomyces lividans TK24]|nr:predicted protein [Streptomyces lividans TK24]
MSGDAGAFRFPSNRRTDGNVGPGRGEAGAWHAAEDRNIGLWAYTDVNGVVTAPLRGRRW